MAEYSLDWVERAARSFWHTTEGAINKGSLDAFRQLALTKYRSTWSHGKLLSFAKSFLLYLAKLRLDARFQAFQLFLDAPKAVKQQRGVTTRVICKEDIERILTHIGNAERDGEISTTRAEQYRAFILFGSYTGQRSLSTISRLRTGQFREALTMEKPTLLVEANQDKCRFAHYVPLAPQLIEALQPLLNGRHDDELMFEYTSLLQWVKRRKIPLTRIKQHFVLGDMRKFCVQYGDILGWNLSNRSHVLSHGLSSIEDKHYRHLLPEHIYSVYYHYWSKTQFGVQNEASPIESLEEY